MQEMHRPFSLAGKVSLVAGAVVFFASAASDYITGQVMNVDGGWISA